MATLRLFLWVAGVEASFAVALLIHNLPHFLVP